MPACRWFRLDNILPVFVDVGKPPGVVQHLLFNCRTFRQGIHHYTKGGSLTDTYQRCVWRSVFKVATPGSQFLASAARLLVQEFGPSNTARIGGTQANFLWFQTAPLLLS
jgi:hypothetical protein